MLISVVSVQIQDEMEQGFFLMGFCRIHSFIQGMTEGSCFTIGYKFSYDLAYDISSLDVTFFNSASIFGPTLHFTQIYK